MSDTITDYDVVTVEVGGQHRLRDRDVAVVNKRRLYYVKVLSPESIELTAVPWWHYLWQWTHLVSSWWPW